MNITIRDAVESDATVLSSVALASKKYWNYPDHWYELWGGTFTLQPRFISNNYVKVAIAKNNIVGFIAISMNNGVAEIEHMWVLPSHINMGIGKKLMDDAIGYCMNHGISTLRVESDPNARLFYEKFGAKHTGYVDSKPKPRKLPVLEINIRSINHSSTPNNPKSS
ncbi:MAG: GNAT family N-acetyltransferase [Gammaproteobacteria bacterium]|nr:GNAT family N-acetyltransferase [Gammaproteobacteria bacterium]